MIDRGETAEALRQAVALDHRVHQKRRMNQENRKAGMKLEGQETRNAGADLYVPHCRLTKAASRIQEFPGVPAFLIHLLAGTFGKVTSADIPARNLSS